MDFTYLFFVVLSFVQCYNAQLSSFFLPPPLTSGAVNTPWLGQQGQWQTPNQGAPDTVPAIPANSAVNSVGQWVSSGGQGTPNTMSAIHANSAFTRGGQGNVLMTEPWAPGESRRVFSRDPQIWFNSCQRTGCPMTVTHCVFLGGFCPSSVAGVPCTCQRGCKVDNIFIPMGDSRIMDTCNNICTCGTPQGRAVCTRRRC